MTIKEKELYVEKKLNEILERDPDTASDITLPDFAKICLKNEEDYENIINYLHDNPEATRIDIINYLFDLPE